MKNFDFKKALPKAVTLLLCVFFIGGVIWGIDSILSMEGTLIPYKPAQSLSPRPQTAQEILDYLNAAISKALGEKPKLSSSESCDLIDCSFRSADEALLSGVAQYIGGSLEQKVEDSAPPVSADFGEGFAGDVEPLWFGAHNLVYAECRSEYYVCGVCGEESDSKPAECPQCGSRDVWQERYRDEYTITLRLADGSASAAGFFTLRTPEEVAALIRGGAAGYFTCGEPELRYLGAKITARVNRLTDQLLSLSFKKETEISLNLDFTGDFAFLGTVPAVASAENTRTLDFTWPGLVLSEHELSIAPKKTEALRASLTCSDPAGTAVRWSVSNESLVTVDSEGYVKAGKKTGRTTVTASFDFQGKTYSDSCVVFVKTSVERLDLSKRRLTLQPGDTAQLQARISPRKATVQTVQWYTSDAAVASVDQNGTVTAVAPGSADVYAVADDGYFKATCAVEVKP